MLVLSRQVREGICIGDGIYVTVLRIDRGRVKLGIEAPPDIRVDREELRRERCRKPSQTAKAS